MSGKAAATKVDLPDVSGAAIQGARSEQQDAYRLRWIEKENAWLLVLADGMGGHAGGGLASRIAVDGFVAAFTSQRSGGATLEDAFLESLRDANARIAQMQKAQPDLADMGTTIVAAYLSSAGVSWVSVGDSPMWVFRDWHLHRLNEDHSMRELAGNAKNLRNMLQSVLNGQPIPMVDCHAAPLALQAGDILLLSSDGILTLSEGEIADIVGRYAAKDTQSIANALLHGVAAYQKSNQDNCSLVIALPPVSESSSAGTTGFLSSLKSPAKIFAATAPVAASALAGFLTVIAAYYFFFAPS